MPHGISFDADGNVWLTDVALHQVFRFKRDNFKEPDVVLGEAFVPGSDKAHFCKPTDVVVSSSGMVYIRYALCLRWPIKLNYVARHAATGTATRES